MKRRILALLLAVLTLTMLTAAAFAADTDLGVFNVVGPLKVLNGTQDGSFYANADTFELNCTGLTGEYSLVLLLEGDSKVPTSGNIQYIDQLTVTNGTAKFTLKPRALTVGTYHIYVSTSDKPLEEIASFAYGEEPEYTLGDVNNDGKVDTNDAAAILLYIVEKYTMTDNQKAAADVNGDHKVNTNDAAAILLYIVGKYEFK